MHFDLSPSFQSVVHACCAAHYIWGGGSWVDSWNILPHSQSKARAWFSTWSAWTTPRAFRAMAVWGSPTGVGPSYYWSFRMPVRLVGTLGVVVELAELIVAVSIDFHSCRARRLQSTTPKNLGALLLLFPSQAKAGSHPEIPGGGEEESRIWKSGPAARRPPQNSKTDRRIQKLRGSAVI